MVPDVASLEDVRRGGALIQSLDSFHGAIGKQSREGSGRRMETTDDSSLSAVAEELHSFRSVKLRELHLSWSADWLQDLQSGLLLLVSCLKRTHPVN